MPLLKNGSDVVSQRINDMTAELASTMARTGIHNLSEMEPTVLRKRTF